MRQFIRSFLALSLVVTATMAGFASSASAQGGSMSFSVTVVPGHNGRSSCPGTGVLTVEANAPVTWCYVVTNTGTVPLTEISVSDPAVDITFLGFDDVAPGASETFFYEGTASASSITSTGSITAKADGTQVSASGSATLAQSVPPTTPAPTTSTTTTTAAPPATTAAPATTATPTTVLATTTLAPTTTAESTTTVAATSVAPTTSTLTTETQPSESPSPQTSAPEAIAFADAEPTSENLTILYVLGAAMILLGLAAMAYGSRG